jgi:hypothetical protein
MIGVWIGGRLLCGLAVRHRHRVMVVMAFHRVLRMLWAWSIAATGTAAAT